MLRRRSGRASNHRLRTRLQQVLRRAHNPEFPLNRRRLECLRLVLPVNLQALPLSRLQVECRRPALQVNLPVLQV